MATPKKSRRSAPAAPPVRPGAGPRPAVTADRVQTGVRLEKRLLKVLKGLAELKDLSLGDLLEGIVLHALEGKAPFSPATMKEIARLRAIYGLTLKAADSHRLEERGR
ncbi:MAG: hypothetical protein QM704_10120 [Anaeromyxobacteraceae bacterium]